MTGSKAIGFVFCVLLSTALLATVGTQAQAQPRAGCPDGQIDSPVSPGRCCWPGQRVRHDRCAGTPTCPPWTLPDGGSCQAISGPVAVRSTDYPDPASAIRESCADASSRVASRPLDMDGDGIDEIVAVGNCFGDIGGAIVLRRQGERWRLFVAMDDSQLEHARAWQEPLLADGTRFVVLDIEAATEMSDERRFVRTAYVMSSGQLFRAFSAESSRPDGVRFAAAAGGLLITETNRGTSHRLLRWDPVAHRSVVSGSSHQADGLPPPALSSPSAPPAEATSPTRHQDEAAAGPYPMLRPSARWRYDVETEIYGSEEIERSSVEVVVVGPTSSEAPGTVHLAPTPAAAWGLPTTLVVDPAGIHLDSLTGPVLPSPFAQVRSVPGSRRGGPNVRVTYENGLGCFSAEDRRHRTSWSLCFDEQGRPRTGRRAGTGSETRSTLHEGAVAQQTSPATPAP